MKKQAYISMRIGNPSLVDLWYYSFVSRKKHINLPIRYADAKHGGTAYVYRVKNTPKTVLKIVDTRMIHSSYRSKLCQHTRDEVSLSESLQFDIICKDCTDHRCKSCEKFTPTSVIKFFTEYYHIMPLLNRNICKTCGKNRERLCESCPLRNGSSFPELLLSSKDKPDDCQLFFLLMPERETVFERYIEDSTNLEDAPGSNSKKREKKKEKQSLTEKQVLKLGLDMCVALDWCAKYGVYHRDLKPANIFFQGSGDNLNFMLGDFGISRPATNGQVTDICTIEFAAPEFREDLRYAPNSDLYSLGVTLFNAAGGRFFADIDPDCELGSWNGRLDWSGFKRRDLVTPELRAIIERALMKQEDRYQAPMEMYEDLKRLYDNYRTSYSTRSGEVRASRQHAYRAKAHSDPLRSEDRTNPIREEAQHKAPQPNEKAETARKNPQQLLQASCDRLSEGDFNGAIALSKQGSDIGSQACEIILAYCRLHLVRKGKLDAGYQTHAQNALQAAAERGEPAALCLCATLAYERGDHSLFLKQLQTAAQKGFPAAQYIYGRGCCEGSAPFQPNTVIGWEYLCSAARSNYGDAIRYCLDYLDTHPQMECAQEIRTLELPFDAMSVTDRRRKDIADSFRNLV